MNTVYVLKGCPASSKSTYCRELMAKEPNRYKRINNDDLRLAFDFGAYSPENEKIIRKTRDFLLKECLIAGFDILHDNVNAGSKNYDEIVKIVKDLNLDVEVKEVPFYIELEEAIERDSKREGKAKVGAEVIKKFWKQLGGTNFKNYVPKNDVFYKRGSIAERFVEPMQQDETKEKCCVFDLDGTYCDISHRNPYDASRCIDDKPNQYVADLCKLMYQNGHKIFFFSGREDKHKLMTEEWLNKHFSYPYQLHMRESGNKEKDVLLKERLFNTYIKGQYNLKMWVDDRLSVCKFVHSAGLPLFRVGQPDSDF